MMEREGSTITHTHTNKMTPWHFQRRMRGGFCFCLWDVYNTLYTTYIKTYCATLRKNSIMFFLYNSDDRRSGWGVFYIITFFLAEAGMSWKWETRSWLLLERMQLLGGRGDGPTANIRMTMMRMILCWCAPHGTRSWMTAALSSTCRKKKCNIYKHSCFIKLKGGRWNELTIQHECVMGLLRRAIVDLRNGKIDTETRERIDEKSITK